MATPSLGAMIETPAAAMLADGIAREVDFLSIGTNDLAQYTLAMDRGHAELAARIDGVHPAVLRMIDITCKGAAVHGKPVAVCGGLAADPAAVPVLLGPRRDRVVGGAHADSAAQGAGSRADARCLPADRRSRAHARERGTGARAVNKIISKLQPIGRALMLPIAVLPVAALLLRLGQPDLLDVPAIAAAGDAIFSNLGLLFAIGVAVGLAHENHGAAGLAARGGLPRGHAGRQGAHRRAARRHRQYSRAVQGHWCRTAFRAKELSKLSVPVGLLSGLIAGWAYNRFSDIRLPSYLAFFGGRRFVPIVSGFAGLGPRAGVRFRLADARERHGCDEPGGARVRDPSGSSPTAC